MVRMWMSTDEVIYPFHSPVPEIVSDLAGILVFAAVHQHSLSAGGKESAVPLTHIYKVDSQDVLCRELRLSAVVIKPQQPCYYQECRQAEPPFQCFPFLFFPALFPEFFLLPRVSAKLLALLLPEPCRIAPP